MCDSSLSSGQTMPSASHSSRSAMTLTEIVIAMGILGTLMIMATQQTIATRDMDSLAWAQDELALEAIKIRRFVGDDLELSWWCTPGQNSSSATLASTWDEDRAGSAYYPAVVGTGVTGALAMKSRWPSWPGFPTRRNTHPATLENTMPAPGINHRRLATSTGDEDFPISERLKLPSFELLFVKVLTGTYSSDPAKMRNNFMNFGDASPATTERWRQPGLIASADNAKYKVLHSSSYGFDGSGNLFQRNNDDGTPYGIRMESVWIDLANNSPILRPQWETRTEAELYADPGASDSSNGVNTEINGSALRDYIYAVVRPPSSRSESFGRLVRAHRRAIDPATDTEGIEYGQCITDLLDNTTGFFIDTVISDYVARIECITPLHNTQLQANEVMITVHMARRVIAKQDELAVSNSLVLLMRMNGRNGQTAWDEATTLVGSPSDDPAGASSKRYSLYNNVVGSP